MTGMGECYSDEWMQALLLTRPGCLAMPVSSLGKVKIYI